MLWNNPYLNPTVGFYGRGKHVPDAEGYPYTERVKPRKYNYPVSLLFVDSANQRRYAPKFFPDYTTDDHLYAAEVQDNRAADCRKKHQRAVNAAERKYGADGPLVSGGLRENWPESAKDKVRKLAHCTSAANSAAHFHRAVAGGRSRR